MLMTLALRSLRHGWRRFAPAVFAVGFSGLLVLLQAAVILGIFSLSSIYVTRSTADLWVGFPGVQSLDLGRPISGQAEFFMRMQSGVGRIEPFLWGSGEWKTANHGVVNVYLVGVDTQPGAMALSNALDPDLRAALETPDSVVIDAADLRKLETRVGDTAEINGRRVRVAGLTYGLRGLGGVNVISSLATTRGLDSTSGPQGDVAYFLARVGDPADAKAVAARLNTIGARRGFEALTAGGFADRTTRYWLSESGAGVAFIFGSLVAVLVAVVITSQTLLAAVSGSIKEYAALRALGFSMSALRTIVLAQSFWVGACGMTIAAVLTALLAVVARAQNVPIILSAEVMGFGSLIILLVALVSGLLALRRVAQADPAALLL